MEPITNKNLWSIDWCERERKRALREMALQIDYEDAKSGFARYLVETKMMARDMIEKGFISALVSCWLRAL